MSFHVVEKISCLEDLRLAIIKVTSATLCCNSYFGFCKNGFFIRKPHSSSDMCKDCAIKVRKEKEKERRKKIRLQIKLEKNKKAVRNIKNKYNRCLKKVKIIIV